MKKASVVFLFIPDKARERRGLSCLYACPWTTECLARFLGSGGPTTVFWHTVHDHHSGLLGGRKPSVPNGRVVRLTR